MWIKITADYFILQANLRWQLIPIHIENNPWWFFGDLGAILAQPFWLGFWVSLHVASYLHILHRRFCGLRGGWWCDLLLAGGFSGGFFAACWGPSCEKIITWEPMELPKEFNQNISAHLWVLDFCKCMFAGAYSLDGQTSGCLPLICFCWGLLRFYWNLSCGFAFFWTFGWDLFRVFVGPLLV